MSARLEDGELRYPDALPEILPPDLLEAPRWIVWRLEPRAGKPKPTKVPYNPRTGGKASSTDPATWTPFQAACDAFKRGDYSGLGFVLGDGIVGVDFDHCRDAETGALEGWALVEINELDTYTEVSPSGTGVHLLMRATLPRGVRKKGAREVYEKDRFFTVTGAHLDETPRTLETRTETLATWHARVFSTSEPARETRRDLPQTNAATQPGGMGDSEVLARAFGARDGETFRHLWMGDSSSTGGDVSASDLKLMGKLRFYTRADSAQMDSLFRQSGRMRAKWDERHASDGATYGEMTIRKAIAEGGDVWTPRTPRARRPVATEQKRQIVAFEDGANDTPAPDDPDTDAALVAFEADDNGNALAVLHLYPRTFLYNPALGWLKWTRTHWRRVPEGTVGQTAVEVLNRRRIAGVRANSSKGEALIKSCKADGRRVQGCIALLQIHVLEPEVDVFDADPDLLNCKNGVLDLRTGALASHDRRQRFTYCVPADYDPNADMSDWGTFIHEATGKNPDVADYLQLCAGYSLTGHTREEKMFYLYGPPRAGKGTFTETMLALLPDPLSSEVDFVSFTARRESDSQNFDLAELKPARVVFASESNRNQSLNPAKIKQMTGGNRIRCAFKHKDMFAYRPQFKVWLVSNHQVNADADDEAMWGRVQVIVFPHSYLGIENLSLKSNLRGNLAGVLRWAAEGAARWYAQGRLTPPADVVEATKEHRATQDYIAQWLEECCTLGGYEWISSASLLQSYRDWCDANSMKPLRANDVTETLVKRFKCAPKRQPHTGNRGFIGISLGVTPEPRVTPGDTSFGEVSDTRDTNEKTPNQVSPGVTPPLRCHPPLRRSDLLVARLTYREKRPRIPPPLQAVYMPRMLPRCLEGDAIMTAQPPTLTARGMVRLAVFDGGLWIRPDADLRDCHVGGMTPTPPTLLDLLTRMERTDIEQLWIHPDPVRTVRFVTVPMPTVDQLAACEAAGWSITVSRADGDTQAGAWLSCTHRGVWGIRHVYYPALDPAHIWHDAPHASGWRMALSLGRFTLATGAFWHRSGGSTGQRLMQASMGSHRYGLTPQTAPAPALRTGAHLDGPPSWLRDLTEPETHARYLVYVDKNAAWLSAAGMASLGVGPVEHVDAPAAATSHRTAQAGLFRITDYAPPLVTLARGLPDPLESHELRNVRSGKGAQWVSLPTVQLLDQLGASYIVREAWVHAQAHRALETWYKSLRDARAAIIGAGDKPALEMLKETYVQGMGWLARSSTDGWDRSEDTLYRPDWYATIKALSRANGYRAAVKAAAAGCSPFAVSTDAWYFLADSPDALDLITDTRGKPVYAVGREMSAWKRFTYDLREYPEMRALLLDTRLSTSTRLSHLKKMLNRVDADGKAA